MDLLGKNRTKSERWTDAIGAGLGAFPAIVYAQFVGLEGTERYLASGTGAVLGACLARFVLDAWKRWTGASAPD